MLKDYYNTNSDSYTLSLLSLAQCPGIYYYLQLRIYILYKTKILVHKTFAVENLWLFG